MPLGQQLQQHLILSARETRRLRRTMELERRKNADDSLFSSMISESSYVYEEDYFQEEDECKQETSSCLPTHIEPVIKIAECRLCDTICSEDFQMNGDDDLLPPQVEHDGPLRIFGG
jgi:hypothetical protein